jgi:hypothetical protein
MRRLVAVAAALERLSAHCEYASSPAEAQVHFLEVQ